MTLDEIRNSTKEVLTPADVAEVLCEQLEAHHPDADYPRGQDASHEERFRP